MASDARVRRGGKVWGARLGGRTSRRVEEYTSSVAVDRRLFAEDIQGSLAHVRMLRAVGLLTAAEAGRLERGLGSVQTEFERDTFVFQPADEDIHTAVERRLGEIAGDVAGKLHTARSRNDQVATDLRLYGRRVCGELMLAAAGLQEALLDRAREHRTTVLPGYTHMQRAQVVSLAHHLLAYVEMLQRDVERLENAQRRSDVSPLGSGALAATTLPIDRELAAAELGFSSLTANSLDAVSDRDFAVEIVFACALLMVHLSRLGEELVLWTSSEFGFAELPDAYATGSSLMPQKKNPDVLELARGRSGRTVGALVSLLTMLKGQPLAYNRDLQEDKQPLFDAVDIAASSLAMLTEVVRVLRFDTTAMRRAAGDPGLLATDVAEWLVGQGVPFREAHGLVARAARQAADGRRSLDRLSPADWSAIDPRVGPEVTKLFDPQRGLRRREAPGGPGPRAVSRQLARGAAMVTATRRRVALLADPADRGGAVRARRRR